MRRVRRFVRWLSLIRSCFASSSASRAIRDLRRAPLLRLLLPRTIVRVLSWSPMSYVDRAFSISDEDVMMEGAYVVHHRPPIKEVALSVGLLVSGVLGIAFGVLMAADRVGGDRTHGVFFALLGSVLFIPGFYYSRIAYYAFKGYKGFSFANIPEV